MSLAPPRCPVPNGDSISPLVFQESTANEIVSHFSGELADLVVCDGAPDGRVSISISFCHCCPQLSVLFSSDYEI